MHNNNTEQQALIDLFTEKGIDVWESLGPDAVPGDDVEFRYNLRALEKQICAAIIDRDEAELGRIMLKLFMDYQATVIENKAHELEVQYQQDQDELHRLRINLPSVQAQQDAGMVEADFH